MHTMTAQRGLFPTASARLLVTIVVAGLAADFAWEFWARVITPMLVGGPLEPAALIQSVFGFQNRFLAEVIHAVVGVVFYPIGYLFIARPLQRLVLPGLPLILTALGFGTGLWIFALYIMAHLIAGLPAFLGFIPLTWVSLAGHLIFGVIVAYVVEWREKGR
ncbi:hypothetical protein BMJ34_01665 [Sinorhizobium medicae]|uniref:DUF1440 domain-containing protein n=1 Tax=Sinorhizobium medicae TaxID=110321 RepID=A0A508X1H5_9HYPH|nr:hypothetical protein BMJ33_14665 [Sinorhizobium medicae]PLU08601.1 hypothetical protein BMJ34_01665 [Sinorhizobium medicae]PLU10924.1 hypothetical protein BMJ29_35975 [Sinorhizobium medicae]PLU11210.1 hypothetical protein BMJ30_30855 [Sinorhizobium medicae]PLU30135.1 hypothetical protein BMJ27_25150 [Sinorhizobium medicae]